MFKFFIILSILLSQSSTSNNRILLIKNDNSSSSQTLLSHIIDFGYVVDVVSPNEIFYNQMILYDAVVVSFGRNQYPVLSSHFRLTLVEYILNGHKTLIEGGEIAAITQGDTTYHGFKTKALRLRQWLAHSGGNLILNPLYTGSTLATYPNILPSIYNITFSDNKDQDVNLPDVYSHLLYYNTSNSSSSGVLVYPNINNPSVIYFSFCYTSSANMSEAKDLLENCLHSLTGYVIGVNPIGIVKPEKFNLYQNYPNPFNSTTIIEFDLPVSMDVSLTIFDAIGKLIYKRKFNNLKTGKYQLNLDASSFSSGTYFYTLSGENYRSVKKMILIK